MFILASRLSALVVAAGGVWLAAESLPDVIERVLPSVVTVAVENISGNQKAMGLSGASAEAYARVLDLGDADESGSGFAIERAGRKYIVTNAHVIERASGAGSIIVYSHKQRRYETTLAGGDSLYDLAILAFKDGEPGNEVTTLRFRRDLPRLGETVLSIGNPLGQYPYSVTEGIVGGLNRRFPDMTGKFGYLQSSASVTWGNSGGPLLDSAGDVVGINTRTAKQTFGDQDFFPAQLNFALEAPRAERLIDEMLANGGHARRAFLGVEIVQDRSATGRRRPSGPPIVAGTLPGSPAETALAGKAGWRVEKVGRTETSGVDDVLEAFELVRPGDAVRLELADKDKSALVTIQAGELTDVQAAAIAEYLLSKRSTMSVAERNGAVILRSGPQRPQSLAANALAGSPVWKPIAFPARGVRMMPAAAKTNLANAEIQVVAAGIVGEREVTLYRIESIRDLGVAAKLVAMTGQFDVVFISPGKENPQPLRLALTDRENTIRRTLFY